MARRRGSKGVAIGLEPEQVKPLARDHEEAALPARVTPHAYVDGSQPELGPLDLRMRHEGSTVVLVEAPHRAGLGGLIVRRQAEHRLFS